MHLSYLHVPNTDEAEKDNVDYSSAITALVGFPRPVCPDTRRGVFAMGVTVGIWSVWNSPTNGHIARI